ncbi:MAG: hypothetical protein HYY48_06300 [Gammaproteobacteria bacterium]|nr:hypothetical protein [Gammaproteobacteria bacterium]
MNFTLAPRRHAALAGGLLLSLVCAVTALLVLPALDARQRNTVRLEQIRFESEQVVKVAAELGSLEAQAQELHAKPLDLSRLLTGGTAALAVADLQKQLKALGDTVGAVLKSTRAVSKPRETPFPAVAASAQLQIGLEALQQFLIRSRTGKPAMIVYKLTIQAPGPRANRTGGPSTQDLNVYMEVSGFYADSRQGSG